MFKISAMICFLAIGSNEMDLCFKSEVPLKFKTEDICKMEMDSIIDYMDADLTERNTTILFKCEELKKIKGMDV